MLLSCFVVALFQCFDFGGWGCWFISCCFLHVHVCRSVVSGDPQHDRNTSLLLLFCSFGYCMYRVCACRVSVVGFCCRLLCTLYFLLCVLVGYCIGCCLCFVLSLLDR